MTDQFAFNTDLKDDDAKSIDGATFASEVFVFDPVSATNVDADTTNVVYVIRVTNQGSATDRNIRVVCEIPAEQTFVAAGGATNGSASGQTVTFAPLPSLAPKASATFRVTVSANAAANIRFKTSMTSDQFTRPVEETEATYLYE